VGKLKTVICHSVLKRVTCSRKVCTFAHNETEINPTPCGFQNCKLVDTCNGVVMNIDYYNRCLYIHNGETKSSFFYRLTQ
jgi:hypothetical protein